MLASGPNPPLTSVRHRGRDAARGNHRPSCRDLAGLLTPERRSRSRRLRALPRHGDSRRHRAGQGRARDRGAAQAVQFKTIKVDDSAYPFEPADILASEEARPTAKADPGRSTPCATTDRMPRHAVLAAQTPFGFPGGTRITVRIDHLDGTIGQGIGRFRLSATTAADPLVGSDLSARLRPMLARPAGERSNAQSEDLAAFFRSTAPSAEARARRSSPPRERRSPISRFLRRWS